EGLELRPDDLWVRTLESGALLEAAVRARDYVLAPDDVRVAHDAVRDEPRMLDRRRVVGDDARDEYLPLRQLHVLPHAPLVLVAHVRRLDRVGAGIDPQDEVDDVIERCVRYVRCVPAAEAKVVADAVLGNAAQGVVERLDAE